MKSFVIPALYSPFEYKINNYSHILEDYAFEWVIRFNLLVNESSYKHFSKAKIFLLISSCYPDCELEELKIANDTLSWIFIWDDECDLSDLGKKPELLKIFHERFLEVLKGADLTEQDIPLSHALYDIRTRMLKIGNQKIFNQFVRNFEDYFNACIQESINRIEGVIPELETYILLRRFTVAGDIFLTLTEFCEHLQIPDSFHQQDIISQLNKMTINILAWCNDIFSASREIASGDVHNLVFVLHHHHKITVDESIVLATKMHNDEIENLINFEHNLLSNKDNINSEIVRYISGLHSWISGNLNWYGKSGRYQSVEQLKALAISNL